MLDMSQAVFQRGRFHVQEPPGALIVGVLSPHLDSAVGRSVLLFVQSNWEENTGKHGKIQNITQIRLLGYSAGVQKVMAGCRGAELAQRLHAGVGVSPKPQWGAQEDPQPSRAGFRLSVLHPSDTELISPPGRAALLILKCFNVMGKVSARRLVRH